MKTRIARPTLLQDGTAFTLIELLVVVSIIALLATMRLSALSNARGKPTMVTCLDNQKQISMAANLYMEQNQGSLVPYTISGEMPGPVTPDGVGSYERSWLDQLYLDGLNNTNVFNCPANPPNWSRWNIGINLQLANARKPLTVSDIRKPQRTVYFADVAYAINVKETNRDPDALIPRPGGGWIHFRAPTDIRFNSQPWRPYNKHQGTCVTTFVDGHAEAHKASKVGMADGIREGDVRAMWDLD
jgi:prepilin-type N-terminal cleavage/methylation domain-containing protein/prepilin-type processing-associated H-X9-DG protein